MIIKVSNLSYSYFDKYALSNISFQVNKGDFVALLGPNGSGKSTLFKCILRFFDNYDGNIEIDGKDIKSLSIKQLSNDIAYVPQDYSSIFNYSVLDTVLMGMTNQIPKFSTPKSEHIKKALNILDELGISDLKNRSCNCISGGERQLVLIGRAIAQQTKIILLDEPASSLDYGNQFKVLNTISKLCDKGYTIIMSTHDPNQAFLYANKALAIKDGKLLTYGNTNDVLTSDMLSYMYSISVTKKEIEQQNGKSITLCLPVAKMRPTMSLWTDDMIHFMYDASNYCNYHKSLAKKISKFLTKNDNILDAGCGIGSLSDELSLYVNSVTAVDINDNVINFFIKHMKNQVETFCCDLHNYKFNNKFDTIIFNYFGKVENILKISKNYCKRNIVIVSRNTDKPGFSFEDNQTRNHHKSLYKYLDENGINYTKLPYEIEFGQPFRTIDDAIKFFNLYRSTESNEITKNQIENKLISIDNDEYKYYYPHKKKIVIINIDMGEINERNI